MYIDGMLTWIFSSVSKAGIRKNDHGIDNSFLLYCNHQH